MLVLCCMKVLVMNLKKWYAGIFFLCSILLMSCGRKENEPSESPSMELKPITEAEVIEETNQKFNLSRCIIQVQTDTQLGSGILWEKRKAEWIVVTAAHVVDGLQEAEVCLVPEEKILPAKVNQVNGLDLAFLTVSTASLEQAVEDKYLPIKVEEDSPGQKAIVIAAGYNPYGELCEYAGTLIEDWIYVEDFDNYMLLCDCKAEAGMSGGAVTTEEGKLVGLVCGENEKELLAVLPVGVIKSEYQLIP